LGFIVDLDLLDDDKTPYSTFPSQESKAWVTGILFGNGKLQDETTIALITPCGCLTVLEALLSLFQKPFVASELPTPPLPSIYIQ